MSTQGTWAMFFLIILNFFTIYSVLRTKTVLNIVFARTLAKRTLQVSLIYLHWFFVQLHNYRFLIFPLLAFLWGKETIAAQPLPAIMISAVSGIALKFPPKNKAVKHSSKPQYSRPHIADTASRCLLIAAIPAFPPASAATNNIAMIQYPACSQLILWLPRNFASRMDTSSVIPMLTAPDNASPPGMDMDFPVIFPELLIPLSPFVLWYAVSGHKKNRDR